MKSYKRRLSASDYLRLVAAVYQDAVAKCSADVYDPRDLKTIRSRIEEEGMSFATITLPAFAKDFERSLADGGIGPTHFRGFARLRKSRRKHGAIPVFLQGMLGHIFDYRTGALRHDKNPQLAGGAASAIAPFVDAVRQICRLVAKVELECTDERKQAALDSFVSVEQSFESFSLRDEDDRRFRLVSRMLWDNLVSECELSACIPRHGPGATAERIMGNQKFAWLRWHGRLEPYFPLLGNAYPLSMAADLQVGEPDDGFVASSARELLENVTVVPEDEELPVRVTLVPKTLKAPRVIAVESVCTQFVQQGIRDWLYGALERYHLTAGHINFRDQTINQKLAIAASDRGHLATIDLSDASDRVPHGLALSMFDGNPDLRDAIDACRSKHAILPDGRMVSGLRKFASMGSALTFPIEAMYFFTIVVSALLEARGLSCTFRNLRQVCREVYVYGDDIICPADQAEVVCEALQRYNCKVNSTKSFWTGRFRESCGVDAYAGQEVTPVYLRHVRPQSHREPAKLISWVATALLFEEKGYPLTAQLMFQECERLVGVLPHLPEGSPGLRRNLLGYRPHWWREGPYRWNEKYQRYEVRALVPSPMHRNDVLVGYPALSKSLSMLEARRPGSPTINVRPPKIIQSHFKEVVRQMMDDRDVSPLAVDEKHLVRTALHGAVTLKRRWVAVT